MKEHFAPAGKNEWVSTENADGKVAGFWQGLWHGIIAPFAFLISLFKEDIGLYETHNNGHWYNFGFIFGLTIILGSNSGAAKGAYDPEKR